MKPKTILTKDIKRYSTLYLKVIREEVENELKTREEEKIKAYEEQLNNFLRQLWGEGYDVRVMSDNKGWVSLCQTCQTPKITKKNDQ